MVGREERRLRRAFRPLLALSLSAPALAAYACSSSGGGPSADAGPAEAGALADNTTADDSPPDDDAAVDGADDGSIDGYVANGDGRIPMCDPDAAHPIIDGGQFLPDGDEGGCDDFFEYTGCAPADIATTGAGCYFFFIACRNICGYTPGRGCFVTPDNCTDLEGGNYILDASKIVVDCTRCLGGRRPENMEAFAAEPGAASDVGEWFARLSHLEGASIAAFRTLRAELVAHGAPRELVAAAERSAREEVRHTRTTARLARRFGASPKLARARRGKIRSLEALAAENAAEGCVRETFGALVAAYQAKHATDPEVRREMKRIAADETRHAALAFAVARWVDRALDDDARARVTAARERAVRALRCEIAGDPPPAVAKTVGLPSSCAARGLLDGAVGALFA